MVILTSMEQQVDNEVHQAFLTARQHTPRFLFRVFHSHSGSNTALNTAYQITPLAFQDQQHSPPSISSLSPSHVCEAIQSHLSTRTLFRTPFSSRTASVATAMGVASALNSDGVEGAHIAVLDTWKLTAANTILWCGSAALIHLLLVSCPEEYRIFGPIAGMPCKTVLYP